MITITETTEREIGPDEFRTLAKLPARPKFKIFEVVAADFDDASLEEACIGIITGHVHSQVRSVWSYTLLVPAGKVSRDDTKWKLHHFDESLLTSLETELSGAVDRLAELPDPALFDEPKSGAPKHLRMQPDPDLRPHNCILRLVDENKPVPLRCDVAGCHPPLIACTGMGPLSHD